MNILIFFLIIISALRVTSAPVKTEVICKCAVRCDYLDDVSEESFDCPIAESELLSDSGFNLKHRIDDREVDFEMKEVAKGTGVFLVRCFVK